MMSDVDRNIELTRRLRHWLDQLGTLGGDEGASTSIDLADIVAASDKVAQLINYGKRSHCESDLQSNAQAPTCDPQALGAPGDC